METQIHTNSTVSAAGEVSTQTLARETDPGTVTTYGNPNRENEVETALKQVKAENKSEADISLLETSDPNDLLCFYEDSDEENEGFDVVLQNDKTGHSELVVIFDTKEEASAEVDRLTEVIKSKRSEVNATKDALTATLPIRLFLEVIDEITKAPTLAEMEADVEKTYVAFTYSGWEWAKAIAAIHESKIYPHYGEPDGWAQYMKERWNIERAQAFRYVAWVRDEIKLLVELQPDTENESIPGDTQEQEAPETPTHKTERASRKARTSRKRGHLNEDDLDELLDHGNAVEIDGQFYALGTEEAKAELARRAAQKQALKKAVEKFPPTKQEEQQVTPPVEPSSTQKRYIMEDGEGGYCTTDEPPEVIDDSLLGTAHDSEEYAQQVIDEVILKDRGQIPGSSLRVLLGRASVVKDSKNSPNISEPWCIEREVLYNSGIPIGIFRLEGTAKKKADAQAYADDINESVNQLIGIGAEFNSKEFLRAVIKWAKQVDPEGTQPVLEE